MLHTRDRAQALKTSKYGSKDGPLRGLKVICKNCAIAHGERGPGNEARQGKFGEKVAHDQVLQLIHLQAFLWDLLCQVDPVTLMGIKNKLN